MYHYRKYRLLKALREDCRKKTEVSRVAYVFRVGEEEQKHDAVEVKEAGIIWGIFIHWFASSYMYKDCSICPFDTEYHGVLVADFESILKDLEKEKLVKVVRSGSITSVYMGQGANEFIASFWWKAFNTFANTWWGKALTIALVSWTTVYLIPLAVQIYNIVFHK